jgi:photosystem II stability/assembly factor-like uncharacterized protein
MGPKTAYKGALVAAAAFVLAASCSRPALTELWQAVEVPTDAEFQGIWFTDAQNGWVTGGGYMIDGGIVGRTRDGGRSWNFRSGVLAGGGTSFDINRVQFQDSLRGCAVCYAGIVLITNDGGENWRPVRYGRSPGDALFDVQFLDARTGWAAGPGSIVQTNDGGESWRPCLYNASENGYITPFAIHFVDRSRGWLVSHGGRLMRSDDGGVTWTRIVLPLRGGEHPTLRDVTFTDEMHGWVVGELGSIFHTVDGGATWARQESGVPIVRVIPKGEPPRPREPIPDLDMGPDRLALSTVAFADTSRGWALGYYSDVAESVVLGTTDGGATWRVERTQPGELLRALYVLDRDHAWAAGDRARTASQVILRYVGEPRRELATSR